MSDEDFDAARFVAAAAALVGIEVTPGQRPGVIMNFENFRALHRRIADDGTPNPPDPIGLFRP
jgi:hypothetical protein